MGIGQLCGRQHLFIARIRLSIADVVPDRSGEQMRILQDDAQRTAQIVLLDQLDIDAVIGDRSFLDVVKTVDQIGDRRLSGTGRTDEGDLLSRLRIQLDVVQDGLVWHIAEGHIMEEHLSTQRHILDRTVGTRMTPCPLVGVFLRLDDVSLFIFLVACQRDRTLIDLYRVHPSARRSAPHRPWPSPPHSSAERCWRSAC